jgi:predicted dehydrogenase
MTTTEHGVTSWLVYLDLVARGADGWPMSAIVDGIPDIENVTEALKIGPYGKCVYESDNDVCDHQVVNLEFSDGSTASLTMVAYSSLICERQTRMHFTHGEIVGDMTNFTVTDFRKPGARTYHPRSEGGGHGGGDMGLIKAFVEAVATGRQEVLGTDVQEVVKSHLTVFAAEASRREGRVIDCMEFEKEPRTKVWDRDAKASMVQITK